MKTKREAKVKTETEDEKLMRLALRALGEAGDAGLSEEALQNRVEELSIQEALDAAVSTGDLAVRTIDGVDHYSITPAGSSRVEAMLRSRGIDLDGVKAKK
jgi:hypothetical protein